MNDISIIIETLLCEGSAVNKCHTLYLGNTWNLYQAADSEWNVNEKDK